MAIIFLTHPTSYYVYHRNELLGNLDQSNTVSGFYCDKGIHAGSSQTVPCPLDPIDAFGLKPQALTHPVLPTLRLFILHYFDEFGTYNKVYHKCGGSYISLGNLPHSLQVKLHNLVPICIVPPNADKNDCHKIFLYQVNELENGVILDLGPILGKVWLVGGLGMTLSDMPEGNHAMGLKNQNVRTRDLCLFGILFVSICFGLFRFVFLN